MITDQLRHKVLREAARLRQCNERRRLVAGLLILVCEDRHGDLVSLGYCGSAGDMPGESPRAVWPGVFAVSEWGKVFVATGGSLEAGAERWEVAA